jgi:antitoxin HigA-1
MSISITTHTSEGAMMMTKRKPASVGEMLIEEFMTPMGLMQGALAKAMGDLQRRTDVWQVTHSPREARIERAKPLRVACLISLRKRTRKKSKGETKEAWSFGMPSCDDPDLFAPSSCGVRTSRGNRASRLSGQASRMARTSFDAPVRGFASNNYRKRAGDISDSNDEVLLGSESIV